MNAKEIAALLPYMTKEERAEVDKLLAADKRIFFPLPGPQYDAFRSEADIVGFGGAAGGGKSYLACGMALESHKKTLMLRREATQLVALIDELAGMLKTRDGFNGQERIWRLPEGRQIELGSVPNIGDERKYQGRPHDLLVFDEASNFLEQQVRFLLGWLRTTDPNQKCTALLCFNPPTTSEGRWILKFFAPWLDTTHPNPAVSGELRWFATVNGQDMELPDGRSFVLVNKRPVYAFDPEEHEPTEIIKPLSRTFIPSRISDNPYLLGTGYMATLQSMPEPLRSQMLRGDFLAGVEDDVYQVIPTSWIEAAQQRWTPKEAKGPMDSLGVDVSRGGRDETIIQPRHGRWFDNQIIHPGAQTPDGPAVVAQVVQVRRDKAVVHIDIVGWGSSAFDFLVSNNIQTVGVNGANKSHEVAKAGQLKFANKRAEVIWRMREALDPTNPDPISLPPDPRLKADLAAPKWRITPTGILVESKEDIAKRIGRSTDRGDAACYALLDTMKTETLMALKPTAAYDPYRDLA